MTGIWAKKVLYDRSSRISLSLLLPESDKRLVPGSVDDRLCTLCDVMPTRMPREGDYKLIYYAEDNRFQLFNLADDPRECRDLSGLPECRQELLR